MRISTTLVIAILCTTAPLAAQGTAVLRLQVLSDAGTPLGNSLVSIPQQRVTRFTDLANGLTLIDLAPGTLRVEIRRLGFQPRDTTVELAAGSTHSIVVTLTRVALRLMPIRVVAREQCEHPGPPEPHVDAALASAFQQLRMNASQYLALVHSYPFNYVLRRSIGRVKRDGARVVEETDSIAISGVPLWSYEPGRVVIPATERPGELFMHLPTMDVFADSVFIANHCFHSGGIERGEDGQAFFRIDFVPAKSLRTSDFEGSIHLDLESLIVRRTVLRLTRPPRIPMLQGLEATTEFIEVAPSLPVINSVYSKHIFGRGAFYPEIFEEQRLVHINFLQSRP